MNLKERIEKLTEKKINLGILIKQAEGIAEKTKSAKTEELVGLEKQAAEISEKSEALKKEIAADQAEIEEEEKKLRDIAEKSIQNRKIGGTGNVDYLKTKESAVEYVKLLVENKGKSSRDVRKEWEGILKTKGVTNLDAILPQPVLLAIKDAFVDYQGVLNHVSKDPRYSAKYVLQTVKNFGKGHANGNTKKEASTSFAAINITAATVYIKYDFDYADLKKDTTGQYFDYVMTQLAKGHIRAVEQAIVVGDGLLDTDEDKITDIKSIAGETETNLFDTQAINASATSYTQEQLEAIVAGVDKILQNSSPILVTTKDIIRKLKLIKDETGKYIDPQPFAPISTTGNNVHGYTAYAYDWMVGQTNPIIAFADGEYTLIGDDVNADNYDIYDITVNQRNIELASVMGGRLSGYKAAVKFTQTA